MEFNSDRKRMSILVTDEEDNKIKLYIKGADSEIIKRLAKTNEDEKMLMEVKAFIQQSSAKGYRVLLMGMKILTDKELAHFKDMMLVAEENIEMRDDIYETIFNSLETEITLIGATTVED